MKKFILSILMIFLLLFMILPDSLFSQNVNVVLDVFIAPNSSIKIHDLLAGIVNADAASGLPLLFRVTITNTNPQQTVSIKLKFGINRGSEPLIEGTSKPFDIGATPIVLDNLSLLSEGNQYSLQNVDVTGGAEDLLSQVMYRGELPPGNYQFWVKILYPDDTPIPNVDDEKSIYIGNPEGNLVLMSPGQRADYQDIVDVYTNRPVFQWQSNSLFFKFALYEEQEHNQGNPQSVINNEVHFEQEVFNSDPNFGATELSEMYNFINVIKLGTAPALYLFQLIYPSEAKDMKPGFNYYWKIDALDGNGNMLKESEIWRFKYADPSTGTSDVENKQVVSLLRSIIGGALFDKLFMGENSEFEGFTFTGEMYNNGEKIDINALHQFFAKFLTGKIELVGAPTNK